MNQVKIQECQKCNNSEKDSINIDYKPIAMAYVPWQQWRNVVDGKTGLAQGTIFGELVMPFYCASQVCNTNRRGYRL